ncbi:MAG: hypothetical protein MR031_05965 [Tenericutes bacterium]|nr:hypothetical protein [Mycoplasmatota bacterium]
MIENLTYEQILSVSNELKKYCDNINQVIEGKEVGELEDFVAAVDSYTKFLDNNVELNQAADLALADLVNQKK